MTCYRKASGLDGSRRAAKSQHTREQILDATLRCLVSEGYAHSTIDTIASRAGVSRGAMTHHFPSRADLFREFGPYLVDVRIAEYEEVVRRISARVNGLPTPANMRETVNLLHHRYFNRPSLLALEELLLGARTDVALRDIAGMAQRELDRREMAVRTACLPVWKGLDASSELLRDMMTNVLTSLAITPAHLMSSERHEHLCDLMAAVSMDEFSRAYAGLKPAGPA